MFERYTTETKRAIYFAAQRALYENATYIDSTHLLLGLVTDHDSRANIVFHIREILPEETSKQVALGTQNTGNKCDLSLQASSPRFSRTNQKRPTNEIGLGTDGKRILAYTAREANQLRDYWIDTEHLVLGILREGENAAAKKLRSVGLDVEIARQRVIESKGSRPPRRNPVLFWVRRRPLGVALSVAFVIGVIAALYLLSLVGGR